MALNFTRLALFQLVACVPSVFSNGPKCRSRSVDPLRLAAVQPHVKKKRTSQTWRIREALEIIIQSLALNRIVWFVILFLNVYVFIYLFIFFLGRASLYEEEASVYFKRKRSPRSRLLRWWEISAIDSTWTTIFSATSVFYLTGTTTQTSSDISRQFSTRAQETNQHPWVWNAAVG